MNGAGDELLSRAGFPEDQHVRIRRSDLRNLVENAAQRFGPADDVLKHRAAHDLFAQREVLVAHAVFVPLALVDVGARRIPANDATLRVELRVVLDEKPAIAAVLPAGPLLDRERFRTPVEARRAVFDYIEGWYTPAAFTSGGMINTTNLFVKADQAQWRVRVGAHMFA